MKYLGLDLGSRTLGVSQSDATGTIASSYTVIRHNEEYVLDYGVLVDPVPYSVTFVDKESGEAVAAPIMGYGSEGERITFAPVTVEEYESDDS